MTYCELLAGAQRNPDGADYHALRMAYSRSPEYAPYAQDAEQVTALQSALKASNLGAALEAALTLLDRNYLDIEAHMVADYVYMRLGDDAESAYHRAFAKGLVAAIVATGDGRGPGGAFIVISVAEEHTVMRMLGLRMVRQALVQHEDRWYDVIDTHHPQNGEPLQVYFDVDIPRRWLSTQLSHAGRQDAPGESPDDDAAGENPLDGNDPDR